MHPLAQIRTLPGSDSRPEGNHDGRASTPQGDSRDRSFQETEPLRWRIALVYVSFVVLFALLSPIYYANRWDFNRKKKRNPFYTSTLVRLLSRYPLLYELFSLVVNFPAQHRIYNVLPMFSGATSCRLVAAMAC
jgi:hypothetical protein